MFAFLPGFGLLIEFILNSFILLNSYNSSLIR